MSHYQKILMFATILALLKTHFCYRIEYYESVEDDDEDNNSLFEEAREKIEDLQKSLLISSKGFLYSIKELRADYEDDQDDFLEDFTDNLQHSMKEPLARLEELKIISKNSLHETEACFKDEDLLTSQLFNETSNRIAICFEDGIEAVSRKVLDIIEDYGVNGTMDFISELKSDLEKCTASDRKCIEDVIEDVEESKSVYPLKYIEAMYEVTVYETGGVILFQGCLDAEKEELERKSVAALEDIKLCLKDVTN